MTPSCKPSMTTLAVAVASAVLVLSSQAGAADLNLKDGVLFFGQGSAPTLDLTDRKTINDEGDNYRNLIYGFGNGSALTITLTGTTLNLTKGNFDPDNTGKWMSIAIQARAGSTINVGTQDKRFSEINIQNHADTSLAVGVFAFRGFTDESALKDSHVNINSDVVDIDVSSKNYWAYGLYTYNNSTDQNIADGERSSIDIKAKKIRINASSGVEGQSVGIISWSQAKVNLEADDIFVKAYRVINTRGNSSVKVNADGRRNAVVRLEGDIAFEYANASGTGVDSQVDIRLMNAESYWVGNSAVTGDSTTDQSKLKVENFSLTLADEARWTSTESSFVNNLTLNNGVLDVSGEDNTLKVDNLQGTSGNVRLGARMVEGRAVANKVEVGSVAAEVKGLDVSFDGVTSDEVETPEEVADLMKNSVTIGSGKSEDFKQTGTVEEGAINGSVSVETDAKGEIVSSTTAENTKLEDFKEVTSVSFVQWRNEVNHLTRRMGDLRSSESGVGAWARVQGGESKVKDSSVEFDTTSVQVGADARVEDWIVGSALSYNDSSIDLANGDGDGESWSLAVYASRFFDSGAFIDLTGRYGYLKNEFTSKDMGVKTDNHAFALSAEVGHRFEVAKNAYVEPQVELAYGFIKGDNVTASNGVRVEQDDAQTLTGRVGLRFGADCPNDRGTVYGLVSYNYEFLGDIESRASLGDKSARMERSLDGGWFSYGIGAQANISKTWSAYGELERTSGGDVENPWRWSVGVRHVF